MLIEYDYITCKNVIHFDIARVFLDKIFIRKTFSQELNQYIENLTFTYKSYLIKK